MAGDLRRWREEAGTAQLRTDLEELAYDQRRRREQAEAAQWQKDLKSNAKDQIHIQRFCEFLEMKAKEVEAKVFVQVESKNVRQ